MRRHFQMKRRMVENLPGVQLRDFEKHFYIRTRLVEAARRGCTKSALSEEVKLWLQEGGVPHLFLRGLSGTWLMKDRLGARCAVFKPMDEEIFAPNNPTSERWRGALGRAPLGVAAGSGVLRERAVYLIDRLLGLQLVPETVIAELESPYFSGVRRYFRNDPDLPQKKVGTLQRYVEAKPVLKGAIPLKQLHALAALDIIVGHEDRHYANILSDGVRFWAIDNALALPEDGVTAKRWRWRDAPYIEQCWDPSVAEKIERLDVAAAEKVITRLGLDHRCALRLRERVATLRDLLHTCPARVVEEFS